MDDAGWQRIRPDIVEYVEEVIRPLRLAHEIRRTLEERLPILRKVTEVFARTFSNVFPPLEDFAYIPEVKAIIDPQTAGKVTTETFNPIRDQLPEILARWKIKYHQDLDTFLKRIVPSIPPQSQGRDLVLAHFVCCVPCSRVFSTSDLTSAVHAHSSWNQRQPPSTLDPAEQAYWRALSRHCICPNSFSYYSVPSKHMMKILEACGKGPLTTVQELDDLDPAFTCTVCRKYPGPREVYTWREAVSRS